MAFSFHQAGMGTKLLAQLSPPPAQALEQIAQSLLKNFKHEFRSVPAFFHDFIDGFWTPFEEVCQAKTEGLKKAGQEIRSLEQSLIQSLSQEQRILLDQFCAALNARNSEELECAFLVGYQTAIRLTLMGFPPEHTAPTRNAPL